MYTNSYSEKAFHIITGFFSYKYSTYGHTQILFVLLPHNRIAVSLLYFIFSSCVIGAKLLIGMDLRSCRSIVLGHKYLHKNIIIDNSDVHTHDQAALITYEPKHLYVIFHVRYFSLAHGRFNLLQFREVASITRVNQLIGDKTYSSMNKFLTQKLRTCLVPDTFRDTKLVPTMYKLVKKMHERYPIEQRLELVVCIDILLVHPENKKHKVVDERVMADAFVRDGFWSKLKVEAFKKVVDNYTKINDDDDDDVCSICEGDFVGKRFRLPCSHSHHIDCFITCVGSLLLYLVILHWVNYIRDNFLFICI